MTLSYRPESNFAEQVIASIKTEQKQKVTEAEMMQAVRTLLIGLGEDPDREGLKDTPKRVMKALQFLTKGYHESQNMNVSKIIVVAGMAGSGKTTWIHQQLSLMSSVSSESVLYFSPGVGNVPIDQKRLAAEFPFLKVFSDGQEAEFFKLLESAEVALIEQGFYLENHSIEQVLYGLNYKKVAH
jgi:signal recognition particle GTPase